jgi:NAD(P)-dependent dehydrogenase (short-subunit alcohol dehydrogenase family)
MGLLSGKTVLVTGATNGIGLESCFTLASEGATLVMVGRNQAKTEQSVAEVKARSGSDTVTSLLCDFSSQTQIRRLADTFRARHDRLDVLVNNAGAVNPTRTVTEDGIETTFAVNHLGYFLLTNLLLDLVEKAAPGARIVNVASGAHYGGTMDFADLGYEQGGYAIMKAYARSKLANVLFTRELAQRLAGKGVAVNCLHPGVVATGIWANSPWYVRPLIETVSKWFFISAAEGGRTLTQLAMDPAVAESHGEYFSALVPTAPSRTARDEAIAKRLWAESERLVKLTV